jgi:hypothetical protein
MFLSIKLRQYFYQKIAFNTIDFNWLPIVFKMRKGRWILPCAPSAAV